jgi:hypothetical protein
MDFNLIFKEFREKQGKFQNEEKFLEILKEMKIKNSII